MTVSYVPLLWDFYARVIQDPDLGPIFKQAVGPFPDGGWPVHIARLDAFWRTIMGSEGSYRGNPAAAHVGRGIQAQHFDRWLQLWDETLKAHLEPPEAARFHRAAQRMAVNLQRATQQEVNP